MMVTGALLYVRILLLEAFCPFQTPLLPHSRSFHSQILFYFKFLFNILIYLLFNYKNKKDQMKIFTSDKLKIILYKFSERAAKTIEQTIKCDFFFSDGAPKNCYFCRYTDSHQIEPYINIFNVSKLKMPFKKKCISNNITPDILNSTQRGEVCYYGLLMNLRGE